MSWIALFVLSSTLGLVLGFSLLRHRELQGMRKAIVERERAVRLGSDKAQLQHPVVDLTRCLGCATCVAVCPEEGVLELVHGQAMVVNGARCVGVSACERECPVGAVTVTLGDLSERDDVPALTEELEAAGSPGLFLAGEITAHALIKTAVDQGTAVAKEVVRRVQEGQRLQAQGEVPSLVTATVDIHAMAASMKSANTSTSQLPLAGSAAQADPAGMLQGTRNPSTILDLCVVGAGPAGIACSLTAKQAGLHFATLDQEASIGGTVAKYPRRKLVMSMPLDLPGYGRFTKQTYEKEELMELWQSIAAESELPLFGNQVVQSVERVPAGHFVVRTNNQEFEARNVCLAMGRRGVPRKLGVPGEELSKVAYHLIDAQSYQGRQVLVVGGGDSAVEAALALGEQVGNQVTLSYRKEGFFRIRAKNEARIKKAIKSGKVRVLFESEVQAIAASEVHLQVPGNGQENAPNVDGVSVLRIPNDDVFVMIGGVPPFEILAKSGVSFDPSLHPPTEVIGEKGSGLIPALIAAFLSTLATLAFAFWHYDYYGTADSMRAAHPKHDLLGPSKGLGLAFGLASCVLIVVNLLYLARRSPKFKLRLGSLQRWMTSHVATGIAALLFALLHGSMTPGDSMGGHAFLGLAALMVTGSIGRYLYAYVPRAANGRELQLSEVKASLGRLSEEWDQGHREFRNVARERILPLLEDSRWKSNFVSRAVAFVCSRWRLRGVLRNLQKEGEALGVPSDAIQETLVLGRSAHRSATMAAHFEDLRALMATWRYLHRWLAAMMVLLVIVHVAYALFYGFSTGSSAGSSLVPSTGASIMGGAD